mgnify:FL=1
MALLAGCFLSFFHYRLVKINVYGHKMKIKSSKKVNPEDYDVLVATYRISLAKTSNFISSGHVLDDRALNRISKIKPIKTALSKRYPDAYIRTVACLPHFDFEVRIKQGMFCYSNLNFADELYRLSDELSLNTSLDKPCDPKIAVSNPKMLDLGRWFCDKDLDPQIHVGKNQYGVPHIDPMYFVYDVNQSSQLDNPNPVQIIGLYNVEVMGMPDIVAITVDESVDVHLENTRWPALKELVHRLFDGPAIYIIGGIHYDSTEGKWRMAENAIFE